MALEPKDLGATTNVFPQSVRLVPSHNKAVKLAIIAGDPILELGTPLSESSTPGEYEVWNQTAEAAGRKLCAFVSPVRHQASSTGETLVVVMIAGDAHRDDVLLPGGQTQNNLDAALRDSDLGKRGIRVQGLEDISL